MSIGKAMRNFTGTCNDDHDSLLPKTIGNTVSPKATAAKALKRWTL
jgi:hypothetical protein